MAFTAKVVDDRFTVVSLGYELTTLLKRTLSYALGRSDRARRDLPGFLVAGTLKLLGD